MPPDTPDRHVRRHRSGKTRPAPDLAPTGPSVNDEHDIKYFRRHPDDDAEQRVPGREFLRTCDPTVRAKFAAALVAVAKAPPHKFRGGGYWEAMHDDMTGWHEVRIQGRHRSQHRLFCLIDVKAFGATKPWLVVVAGMSKPFRTTFADAEYKAVRELGEEYLRRNPRSVI